jgi:hypothetical protein
MLTDTLGRRKKHGPAQPTERSIKLNERDHLIFELLNRHGPLPSTYIFEMTRHLGRQRTHLIERLTHLRHGYIAPTGEHITYLSKPAWQGTDKSRHFIYDLTDYSEAVLDDLGTRVIRRKREHPLHRFMGATVSASLAIYINAQRREFHDRNRILAHESTPEKTRDIHYPFTVNTTSGAIEPDDFFAVQEPSSTKAPNFYAVEYDRHTETMEDSKAHTSYGRKLKHYIEALNEQAFQKHLGIPNKLKVLTITNNERHKKNMQKYAASINAGPRFLFAHVEGFSSYGWNIPPLMLVRFETADGTPVEL